MQTRLRLRRTSPVCAMPLGIRAECALSSGTDCLLVSQCPLVISCLPSLSFRLFLSLFAFPPSISFLFLSFLALIRSTSRYLSFLSVLSPSLPLPGPKLRLVQRVLPCFVLSLCGCRSVSLALLLACHGMRGDGAILERWLLPSLSLAFHFSSPFRFLALVHFVSFSRTLCLFPSHTLSLSLSSFDFSHFFLLFLSLFRFLQLLQRLPHCIIFLRCYSSLSSFFAFISSYAQV